VGSGLTVLRIGESSRGGFGVFAARNIAAGEHIGTFDGTETATQTRMSLQFGPRRHIEPAETSPLRFLNHACHPNAAFGERELFACADIPPGVGITIDYNCHEDALEVPFPCRCVAPDCVGTVRGWRHLTEGHRAARREYAGSWLVN
jgi:SET domain-containing protein